VDGKSNSADVNIYVGSHESIAGWEEPSEFTFPSTATIAFPKLFNPLDYQSNVLWPYRLSYLLYSPAWFTYVE